MGKRQKQDGLVAEEEEVYFPREPASKNDSTENVSKDDDIEKIFQEPDNLFSTKKSSKKQLKKENKQKRGKRILEEDDEMDVEESIKPAPLGYSKLSIGSSIFGCVMQIGEVDVVVSLPNGMRGVLALREVSDNLSQAVDRFLADEADVSLPELSDLFSIGMFIRCVILDVSGTKVELSLRPALINRSIKSTELRQGITLQGSLSSIEDHGYIVDMGIEEIKGFLPFSECDKEYQIIGQPLSVSVQWFKPEIKRVGLSCKSDQFSKSKITGNHKLDLEHVQAGMLIGKVSISAFYEGKGAIVNFLGGLRGMIHSKWAPSEEFLKEHTEIKARVVYVDYQEKLIALNCKHHLVDLTDFRKAFSDGETFLKPGQLIEEAEFIETDRHGDAKFTFNGIELLAKSSELGDKNSANSLQSGSKYPVRIIGMNYLDGFCSVSRRPNVLAQSIFSIEDVKIGDKVFGEIIEVTANGALNVRLSEFVSATCPNFHTGDMFSLSQDVLNKKFPVSSRHPFRILKLIPEKNKIILTHKSILMSSKLPILSDIALISPGMISHGFVSSIKATGLYVTFYNEVFGFLPSHDLRKNGYTDILDNIFQIGQVVKVKVVKTDENRVMVLSINVSKSSEKVVPVSVGSLVDCKILEFSSHSVFIGVDGSEAFGNLHMSHLTDLTKAVDLRFELFKKKHPVGSNLENVLVLRRLSNQSFVFSLKPSLISASRSNLIPSSSESLSKGGLLVGYVSKVDTHKGLYVSFLSDAFGRVSRNAFNGTDGVQLESFSPGQTIITRVLRPPTESSPLSLAIVNQLNKVLNNPSLIAVVEDLESGVISDLALLMNSINLSVGEYYSGKVLTASAEDGAVIMFNELKGITTQSNLRKGEKKLVQLIDYDFQDCIAEIRVVKQREDRVSLPKETPVQGIVIDIKDNYAVVDIHGNLYHCLLGLWRDKLRIKDEVSCVLNDMNYLRIISRSCFKVNTLYEVEITDFKGSRIEVALKQNDEVVQGFISAFDLSSKNKDPLKDYKIGQRLSVKCVIDDENSLFFSTLEDTKPIKDLGFGFVDKVISSKGKKLSFIIAVDRTRFVSLRIDGMTLDELRSFGLIDSSDESIISFENMQARMLNMIGHRVSLSEIRCIDTGALKSKSVSKATDGSLIYGIVNGFQSKLIRNINIGDCSAGLHVTDCSDDYSKNPFFAMNDGDFILSIVMDDNSGKKYVSCRRSRLQPEQSCTIVDDEVTKSSLKTGQVVRGYVKAITDNGVFISLSKSLDARVLFKNLSDKFVKDPRSLLETGQLVKGKVLSYKYSESKIEMSLKPSIISVSSDQTEILKHISVNSKVSGTVKSVRPFGVFVKLDGFGVVGMCHRSEISDEPISADASLEDLYSQGDKVVVVILGVDIDSGRVSLGMKLSSLESAMEVDFEPSEVTASEINGIRSDEKLTESDDDDDHDEKMFDWEDEESENHSDVEKQAVVDKSDLKLTTPKKRKNTESHALQVLKEETELSKLEALLADASRAPETADDFERLVLSEPNSSSLWIRYMAFFIHIHEIDRAREIAERALKTISFREENEKFNVWMALVNLENMFGSTETLSSIFQRALEHNDPKRVYLQAAAMYTASEKPEMAEECYNTMIKKFRETPEVWISYASMKYSSGDLESARSLLKRALKALPKELHIRAITQFALLEFKVGSAERGRTLFQGMLSNYPKRTDLWSVFLDQELKCGDLDHIRQLFDQITSLSIQPKKMKPFFKRYLDFEKKFGTEETVEKVKESARAFVQSRTEE